MVITSTSFIISFRDTFNNVWKLGNYTQYYSLDSVIGYGLDDKGVALRVPISSRISFLHVVQTGSGPNQPPIQWLPAALSPGVKRPGREADTSN
jgi:hypothetical protein